MSYRRPTNMSLPPAPGTPTPNGTGIGEGDELSVLQLICEEAAYSCEPCKVDCGPVKAINEIHERITAALSTPKRDEEQAGEIERLKLDLEAQECLQDSAYKAGVKHGWNLCVNDEEDGYQRIANNTEHIAELRRIRADRAALQSAEDCGEVSRS